jgi:drug/metabolite transporter (DMT)-like permease
MEISAIWVKPLDLESISLARPVQLEGVNDTANRGHALRMLILTVLLRPFGNLSLAFGMKHIPGMLGVDPLPYLRAFANPFVSGGILMLILSLLTRMALMSLVDLSVILPLTATGYILSVFLGNTVLGEHVAIQQWLGTFLIFAGVALVGTTRFSTTNDAPAVAVL